MQERLIHVNALFSVDEWP